MTGVPRAYRGLAPPAEVQAYGGRTEFTAEDVATGLTGSTEVDTLIV